MTKEEVEFLVKQASQNAWKRETATTVNDIIERTVLEVTHKLNDEFNHLQEQVNALASKKTKNAS